MTHKQFLSQIVFRQWKLIGLIAKLLRIRDEQVERLKPKLSTKGAIYTFAVAVDESEYDEIDKVLTNVVQDGSLAKV